jgi:hypothetical protein
MTTGETRGDPNKRRAIAINDGRIGIGDMDYANNVLRAEMLLTEEQAFWLVEDLTITLAQLSRERRGIAVKELP